MGHIKVQQYLIFDYYIDLMCCYNTAITFQIFHIHTLLFSFSILNSANA